MFAKQIIVFLALCGMSMAQNGMSCGDCHHIAEKVSHGAMSDAGVNATMEWILEPVCAMAPADSDCTEEFPGFWVEIGGALFDAHEGVFSAQHLCPELGCHGRNTPKKIECMECTTRLGMTLDLMTDEEFILSAVTMVQEAICSTAECEEAISIVLPIALPLLQEDREWVEDFCTSSIHCV